MIDLIKSIVLLLISIVIGGLVSIAGAITIIKLLNINNDIGAIIVGVIFGNLGAEIGMGLYKKIR